MSGALRNEKQLKWDMCKTTFAVECNGWWKEVQRDNSKGSNMLLQSNRPLKIVCCLISQAPCMQSHLQARICCGDPWSSTSCLNIKLCDTALECSVSVTLLKSLHIGVGYSRVKAALASTQAFCNEPSGLVRGCSVTNQQFSCRCLLFATS